MSFASPSSSRCSRAAISTGCTSPLNARAKTPFTAPSTFFSNRSRMPMSLLPQATLDASRRLHRGADHVVFVTQMVLSRITIAAADNGWRASLSRLDHAVSTVRARVAERQTRWLQVPVSARTWGFKSPLAHQCDVARHIGRLEPLTRLWSGLANSLGLIIHGWVEDQFADDLAGGA